MKKLSRFFILILIVSLVFFVSPAPVFASSDDTAKTITETMDADETMELDEDEFNSVCDKLTGEKLDYVKFDLPDKDDGVLYYDYDEDDDKDDLEKVSGSEKYYYSKSPYIASITFVPDEDFSGTLSIEYTGRDVDRNTYSGKLKIKVEEVDTADVIEYSEDQEEIVDFEEDDFDDVCDDVQNEDLDYIRFTDLPDRDDGTLYYDYDEDDSSHTKVTTSKKYYYEDHSPYLKRVSFVPDEDFSGTVTVKYKGYDVDGESYSGKIKITIDEDDESDTDIIEYSEDEEETVEFDDDDFADVCDDVQDEELDYIKFTSLPDRDEGLLYYDYDEDDANTKVTTSKKYYYDRSPYLKRVSFVPDEDFSGTVTIKYKGYDVDGDYYSGKIKITIGDGDSSDNIIRYQIDNSGDVIDFDEEDFNDVSNEKNDEDLDYIKLRIPSAKEGILYYNYEDGQYSSIVSSNKKYYYDSSLYLSRITFVPNEGFSGTVTIPYTGYDEDGDSFSGTIAITVGSGSSTANVISYSTAGKTAVVFKDGDFNNVCKDLLGNQLSFVKFSLPSSSYGTLYYGYSSSGSYTTKVNSSTKYYYGGSPYLLNVAFVPAENYTGTVGIVYTGYDIRGISYTGTVQITVSSNGTQTPIDTSNLVSSKYFKDVDISYSWAVPYIDSLYEDNIISGSTIGTSKLYSPASYVTRGDFMLILYRALKLKTISTANSFIDVPAGSYYYDAIMTAQALGIAQGSYNQFHPNDKITREDAMVFVQRAVNITGSTLPTGDTAGLSSFRDYSSISDYSKSAIASLVKARIITGSDDNKVYPQGNLSRAQVAAIVYRVINL